MAKRANPFIEDIVQQSKVHVGLKQFNNNEYRLKKVYEKTLELLYKGAKKSPVLVTVTDEISHNRKDKMKQLMIGKDGTLSHAGTVVAEKNVPLQLCACGRSAGECRCGYCEKALCSSCQHHCTHCDRAYCSQCSLSGSEGTEVCVSCYG